MPTDDEIREQVRRLMRIYDPDASGYVQNDFKDRLVHNLFL